MAEINAHRRGFLGVQDHALRNAKSASSIYSLDKINQALEARFLQREQLKAPNKIRQDELSLHNKFNRVVNNRFPQGAKVKNHHGSKWQNT